MKCHDFWMVKSQTAAGMVEGDEIHYDHDIYDTEGKVNDVISLLYGRAYRLEGTKLPSPGSSHIAKFD